MQAIRICFVGDSIVNGTGDETALGWAGRLCAEANLRGQVTYYNLGIPGDTSADLRARWEGECALRLPADCDGRVVFSCGINDMLIDDGQLRVPLEQSRANLQAILRQAREKYHVLLAGPTPVSDAQHNQRLAEIAEIYGQVAAQLEVVTQGMLYGRLRSNYIFTTNTASR